MAENEVLFSMVDVVIERLGNESAFVREEAAFDLIRASGQNVARALIARLGDPVARVRFAAAKALSMSGRSLKDETVAALIKSLDDPEPIVASAAAQTLGAFQDPSLFGPLSERLAHPDAMVRLCAVLALGRLGDKRAEDAILTLLRTEKDRKVRATAMIALGRVGTPRVAPVFMKYGLKDQDGRVRASAIEALGSLGLDPATVVPALQPFLQDPENRARANAVVALYRLGRFEALDALSPMLKSEDKWTRASAAFVCGQIGTAETAAYLESLAADPEAEVRLNVARAFGRIASARAFEQLLLMLRDDDDLNRREIYRVLLHMKNPSLYFLAVQKLDAWNEVYRFVAAQILRNLADPRGFAPLFHQAAKEKNAELKGSLLEAAEVCYKADPVRALQAGIGDRDATHRLALVARVAALPRADRNVLVQKLAADGDPKVRDAATPLLEG